MPGENELVATLTGIRWRAEDDTAVIASVRDKDGQTIVVKGPPDAGPALMTGLTYRWHGRWERHDRSGDQFAFATFSACVPADKRGTIAYLVAIAECVGEKRAERLWERYGPLAVQTLRSNPGAVAEAGIMPLDEALEASRSLHSEAMFESVKVELLGLLAGRGFQASKVIKECLRLWGARAPEMVRRNPYLLLLKKLPSCGWNRCDRLYLDLGHKPDRLKRQALCAVHFLRSDSTGNTWAKAERIGQAVVDAVPNGDPLRALRLAIRARLLVRRKEEDGVWIAERQKAQNESTVADKAKELLAWRRLRKPDPLSPVRSLRASLLATLVRTGTPA